MNTPRTFNSKIMSKIIFENVFPITYDYSYCTSKIHNRNSQIVLKYKCYQMTRMCNTTKKMTFTTDRCLQSVSLHIAYRSLCLYEKMFRNILNNLKIFYLILISICVLTTPVLSHKCDSFKQVFGQFVDKNGYHFNQTIDGCIERTKFDGKTIVEAYIRHQDLKTIGNDSVRNVIHLSTISFWGCNTEQILPGAFRNVLDLKTVQISYCELKEIPKGK